MKTTPKREHECTVKIGHRVRLIRKAHKLTQVELAELANINSNYLGQVERGELTISVSKLLRIADALNVSLGELVDPCLKPSAVPVEELRRGIKEKIDLLSDLDVLVVDRIADYLRAESTQTPLKE